MELDNNFYTLICAALASPLILKLLDELIILIKSKVGKTKDTQLDRIERAINSQYNRLTSLDCDLSEIKLDQLRTNLLLLLRDYRSNSDIPTLAESYIRQGGNSYVIPLLVEWYAEKGLDLPEFLEVACEEHRINIERFNNGNN